MSCCLRVAEAADRTRVPCVNLRAPPPHLDRPQPHYPHDARLLCPVHPMARGVPSTQIIKSRLGPSVTPIQPTLSPRTQERARICFSNGD